MVPRIGSAACRDGCVARSSASGGSLRLAKEDSGDVVLRRVERIACGMCALIAAITVLMEVKPC